METKITLPETVEVTKRDGSAVTVDVTKIPAEFFAEFAVEGIAEYIRDSSSTALLDAYRAAHKGEDGDADARKAWGESNVDAIAKHSVTLMTDAADRLYDGERRARSGGGSSPRFTPLQDALYKVAREAIAQSPGGTLGTAWSNSKGMPTPERKAVILEAVESLPKASRNALVSIAQSRMEEAAALPSDI